MADMNLVALTGRITADAEVKYTQSGTGITRFTIAVNRRVKKNGQWEDEGNFFDCTLFTDKLAEYLAKGKQIAISGQLNQQRWESEGQKHSRVVIICDSIQFLGGKQESTVEEDYDVPF